MSRIAFVLKGYPRLSETFIAQEILGLERRGFDILIVSLRHPTDKATHPVHAEIRAPILYLPEYLYQEPWRVLKALVASLRKPGFLRVLGLWLRDLGRDFTPNRGRRFGQALVLAVELPADVTAVHFHFLHTPASVARYATGLLGLPLSGSAHAKDIWTSPDWEIAEKLGDVDWLTTCTRYGAERLRALSPDPERVRLHYHGIDLSRFPPPPEPTDTGGSSTQSGPVRLISVGRAVEKKGYDDLLRALAGLPQELDWHLEHIGGGGLIAALKGLADSLGISARITWRGAQPQDSVLAAMRRSDLFVLANRVAGDGDRDGLPNVLMEAQSQGLCVVASRVAAAEELIEDGVTGRLLPVRDIAAWTECLADLICDPQARRALGAAGRARVRSVFAADRLLDALAAEFTNWRQPPDGRDIASRSSAQ